MIIKFTASTEKEFLSKYLEFYNLLVVESQRLNPSEIALITEFATLPPKFEYQRFSSLAKAKVIESAANRSWHLTKLNINNKLYALLDKEFLKRDVDKVIYLPKHLLHALATFRAHNSYTLTVEFNGSNEDNGISEQDSSAD